MVNESQIDGAEENYPADKGVTSVFVMLLITLVGATLIYWFLLVEPRLLAESRTTARAIAYAQGTMLSRYVQSAPNALIDGGSADLKTLMADMLLLTDQQTKQPFISGLSIELAEAQAIVAGQINCVDCIESEVPLYNKGGELIALLRIYGTSSFYQSMRAETQRGLLLWLLGLLLLTLLGWRILARSQQRLRQSQDYAATVFLSSPLPLLLAHVDSRSVIRYNTAAESLLGRVEKLPENIYQIVEAAVRGNVTSQIEYSADAGLDDIYVQSADGKNCPVLAHATPLVMAGRHYVVVALVDISERKDFETQLYAARDKAESASRAKGAFLAAMSHEVRTPLNGIVGFADLLKQTDLQAVQREYLNLIELSAQNLLSLIEEILDFSRMEAGKIEIRLAPLQLHQLIKESTSLFKHKAKAKGIELSLSIDEDLPVNIESDAKRLQQIINILLDNAIKFTEVGGVQILVQALMFDVRPMMRINVIDTGIGIDPNHIEKLFQPFYQVDQGTTRRFGGTGLGLVIARNFARRMGGDILVESIREGGSRFMFELPLKVLAEKDAASTGTLLPLSVLVVDDDSVNRLLLKHLLEREGVQVEEAQSAKAALIKMSDTVFDIVFIDINMPSMDGLQLAEKVREQSYRKGIDSPEMIAVSAAPEEKDRQRASAQGVSQVLTKPVEVSVLQGILKNQLERRQ